MAKKVKKIIDAERLRDIETYEYKNQQRSNNPPVGMAQYDTMQETSSTYMVYFKTLLDYTAFTHQPLRL